MRVIQYNYQVPVFSIEAQGYTGHFRNLYDSFTPNRKCSQKNANDASTLVTLIMVCKYFIDLTSKYDVSEGANMNEYGKLNYLEPSGNELAVCSDL